MIGPETVGLVSIGVIIHYIWITLVSLVSTWYQWPGAFGKLMAGHGVSYQGIARDWRSVTDIGLPWYISFTYEYRWLSLLCLLFMYSLCVFLCIFIVLHVCIYSYFPVVLMVIKTVNSHKANLDILELMPHHYHLGGQDLDIAFMCWTLCF